MKKVMVSVVVPIYNVEKYLCECLDSIERQTYKDFEVLLINDGSTDNSKEIAEEYLKRNSNFVLYDRENGGLSAARNTGIKYAKGKYIYFLDSDDYLIETAIDELVKKAEKEKLDVLKFGAYTFTEPSNQLNWNEDGYMYQGTYPSIYSGVELLQRMENNKDYFPSCCLIFIRKAVIKNNNLRFYEGIIHEDNLFHWELLALSERTTVLNKPLYCRRYREGSITQTKNWSKKMQSMVISLEAGHMFLDIIEDSNNKAICEQYLKNFALAAASFWCEMDEFSKKNKENKIYEKKLRKYIRSYGCGESLTVKLFAIHPRLYQVCRFFYKIPKKLLEKSLGRRLFVFVLSQ